MSGEVLRVSLLRLTLDHFVGRRGKFFRWFWLGVYPSSGRHLVLWFWVSLRVGAEFEFLSAPIHPPLVAAFGPTLSTLCTRLIGL